MTYLMLGDLVWAPLLFFLLLCLPHFWLHSGTELCSFLVIHRDLAPLAY